METIQPKGLSQSQFANLGLACDCMCSADQLAGAKGSGMNSSTCGCFCSDPESATNNANKNTATNKDAAMVSVLGQIATTLQEISRDIKKKDK